MINSTDYFLYLPLLPQVGAGLVEPRHICVSLLSRMPKVRFVLGTVTSIDPRQKVVTWSGPEGTSGEAGYDRLILTAGSVNKLLPVPGVADYAHGFRSIAEAIYLRDHITRQLELAAVATDAAERAARCTFVVVGAGYTGTEVAAHGQLLTTRLARQMPGLAGEHIRWMLLDTAPRLLPELDPHLSRTADRVLRRRGVEVRTGQSVAEAMDGSWVQLSTGEKVPTHSLIWCVGVRADPLVSGLDLDTNRGRLVVDEFMAVPGAPDIYACGDCATVPDLTRLGEICGMTAQHAQRQGKQVARNVAASLGIGQADPYKHHDLGFLVDLGGLAAAANPLNIPLSGPPASVVTRAYHLIAMAGNRARVLAEWGLNVIVPAEVTSFGVIGPGSVPLDPDQPRSLPGITSAAPHRRSPRGPQHRSESRRIQIDAYCKRACVEHLGGANAEPARGIGAGQDPQALLRVVAIEDVRGSRSPAGAHPAYPDPDAGIGLKVPQPVGGSPALGHQPEGLAIKAIAHGCTPRQSGAPPGGLQQGVARNGDS